MKIDELRPIIKQRIEFELSKIKYLPDAPGCYVITNFQNEILYIGQARSLRDRIKDHLKDKNKTGLTIIGRAYYVYYKETGDPFKLSKLERGWINLFELTEGNLPILNSLRGPL